MSDTIKVAVRMRSLIPREIQNKATIHWVANDSFSICQNNSGSSPFVFDRVFKSTETNDVIYEEFCSPIVNSVINGFNGTIFAYGQTSSGKTFTIMGDDGINMGIAQYTVSDLFDHIQSLPDREFLVRVSYMEIYNEMVIDLLSNSNENLKLQEDQYGNIKVNKLTETIVQEPNQVLDLMRKGQRQRKTGDTLMNNKSSRSHSIFRMIIESGIRGKENAAVNVSHFNIVDLAGSEKASLNTPKGTRFKEDVNINKSLFMLSQVISQLSAEKEYQFINYRDSKLTRILQNSLGGNALTAIICTIRPASLYETLLTLKFALRAKKIKNKPQINEVETEQALLKKYANKIKKLREELEATKEEKDQEKKIRRDMQQQIENLKKLFVTYIAPHEKNISESRETETSPAISEQIYVDTSFEDLNDDFKNLADMNTKYNRNEFNLDQTQEQYCEMNNILEELLNLKSDVLNIMKDCVESAYCGDVFEKKLVKMGIKMLQDLVIQIESCVKNKSEASDSLKDVLANQVSSLQQQCSVTEISLKEKEKQLEVVTEALSCLRENIIKRLSTHLPITYPEFNEVVGATSYICDINYLEKAIDILEKVVPGKESALAAMKECKEKQANGTQTDEMYPDIICEKEKCAQEEIVSLKQKIKQLSRESEDLNHDLQLKSTELDELKEIYEKKLNDATLLCETKEKNWKIKVKECIKNKEEKYEQEMNNQEKFFSKIKELGEKYQQELKDLEKNYKEEVSKLKTFHDENLSQLEESLLADPKNDSGNFESKLKLEEEIRQHKKREKVISLQTDIGNMTREIAALKRELLSKSTLLKSCNCGMIIKNVKPEKSEMIQDACKEDKVILRFEKMKDVLELDIVQKAIENAKDEQRCAFERGMGPASDMKCLLLQKKLHKKDKEIQELKDMLVKKSSQNGPQNRPSVEKKAATGNKASEFKHKFNQEDEENCTPCKRLECPPVVEIEHHQKFRPKNILTQMNKPPQSEEPVKKIFQTIPATDKEKELQRQLRLLTGEPEVRECKQQ